MRYPSKKMDSYFRVSTYTRLFFDELSTFDFKLKLGIEKEYINWKGIRSVRNFFPLWLFYGRTSFHPKLQWLLWSWDIDKKAFRTYAINYFCD